MALPTRPTQGPPPERPKSMKSEEPEGLPSLPTLPSLPKLPANTKSEPQAPKTTHRATAPVGSTAQTAPATGSTGLSESELEDGWAIDEETGKKYKVIGGYKPGVMQHSKAIIKAGGFHLDQLKKIYEVDEDFDMDDLNGSAETFLAHLRVPPSKEEQLKLREERARRQMAFDANIPEDDEQDQSEIDYE